MNKPIERCVGKAVPFGTQYVSECRTCARAVLRDQSNRTVWVGPVTFDVTCPYKVKDTE